jgi:hypothetical protein
MFTLFVFQLWPIEFRILLSQKIINSEKIAFYDFIIIILDFVIDNFNILLSQNLLIMKTNAF